MYGRPPPVVNIPTILPPPTELPCPSCPIPSVLPPPALPCFSGQRRFPLYCKPFYGSCPNFGICGTPCTWRGSPMSMKGSAGCYSSNSCGDSSDDQQRFNNCNFYCNETPMKNCARPTQGLGHANTVIPTEKCTDQRNGTMIEGQRSPGIPFGQGRARSRCRKRNHSCNEKNRISSTNLLPLPPLRINGMCGMDGQITQIPDKKEEDDCRIPGYVLLR